MYLVSFQLQSTYECMMYVYSLVNEMYSVLCVQCSVGLDIFILHVMYIILCMYKLNSIYTNIRICLLTPQGTKNYAIVALYLFQECTMYYMCTHVYALSYVISRVCM